MSEQKYIMSQATIKNLITSLHERFGDDLTSPQQQQLMEKLNLYSHKLDQKEPVDPDIKETLELLLEELEVQHPQAAGIIRQVIEALGNMGI
jgi:hypothetical protein